MARGAVLPWADPRQQQALPEMAAPTAQQRGAAEPAPNSAAPLPDAARPKPEDWQARAVSPESWWLGAIGAPLFSSHAVPLSAQSLVMQTLQHSFQIRVDAATPRLEQTRIVEAAAEFDWNALVTGTWRDTSDPVGSLLDTNGARFRREHYLTEAGLRRRNLQGGDLSVTQNLGYENTNSQFFSPPHQGQTQLLLRYDQPLLRGRGTLVNRSTIVLAELETSRADGEFLSRLQQRLRDVVATYWDLYVARGELVIQQRLVMQAERVSDQLRLRENVDGSVEQLLRAGGAVESRRGDLLNARRAVLDLQARLRNLVNSPELSQCETTEFLITDEPARELVPSNQSGAFAMAMSNRPDFAAAMQELRQAAVRNQVADNDLLPDLKLVLESYVKGLRGESDIADAFAAQFKEGEPSYSVGFQWQAALGRRADRAAKLRASLEVAQAQDRLQVQTEQIWLEVGNAVRQLHTAYQRVARQRSAMLQFSRELHLLTKRRELLPPRGQNGSLLLTDLLNSQDRLADAERRYLRSRADYALALIELQRSMGTLTATR
ncbi:MAG: TolC family protein [Planctomycetales bacterium]|nr:TolC family protein [Planctomycetales bacterium]